MSLEIILFVWVAGTIMNGAIAKEKGRNITNAVLCSIFLSPMMAYFYLLAVPVKPPS